MRSFCLAAVLGGAVWLSSPVLAEPSAGAPQGSQAIYVVKVDAPRATKAQRAVARVEVVPATGYRLGTNYATTLVLKQVPAGVGVDKLKFSRRDASWYSVTGVEFEVPYTAREAGKKTVGGEVRFAICQADECHPARAQVSFQIDVK